MNLTDLKNTQDPSPLPSAHLRALWHDLHGDWDRAHAIVQQMSDTHAMWIHAYLHRKEPDLANARYWYRSAAKPFPTGQSFAEEAAAILADLETV